MKRILLLALAAGLFYTSASAQSQRLSRTNKKPVPTDTTSGHRTGAVPKDRMNMQTDADRNNPTNPSKPATPATSTPATPNGTSNNRPPAGTTTNPVR